MNTSGMKSISLQSLNISLVFGVALSLFVIVFIATDPTNVFASVTNGTIDATNRYAYMESGSWIDLGNTQGNVQVTDTALSGYAWSAEYGWISLNCSNDSSCATVNYGVANDGNGVLSG